LAPGASKDCENRPYFIRCYLCCTAFITFFVKLHNSVAHCHKFYSQHFFLLIFHVSSATDQKSAQSRPNDFWPSAEFSIITNDTLLTIIICRVSVFFLLIISCLICYIGQRELNSSKHYYMQFPSLSRPKPIMWPGKQSAHTHIYIWPYHNPHQSCW
jgi:hypothetical protein